MSDPDDLTTWVSMKEEEEVIAVTENASVTSVFENLTIPTVLATYLPISECEKFNTDYGIIPASVCALALLLGIMFCFFGYRLFKGTVFTSGFIFGSSIVYFVCVEENVLPLGGKIGLAVGAGLMCALTAIFVNYIGLFFIGFNSGFLLAVAGFVLLEQIYHPFTKWIPFGVVLGVAVVCALLTLYWQKGLMMLGTGMLGSALILIGVDFFVNSSRVLEYTHDRLTASQSTVVLCLYGWLIMGLWPALAVAGAIVQWRITGSSYDHKKQVMTPVTASKRTKHVSRLQESEDDPESQDTHYRQLYRIRRVNGDVISRNYMQNVQQHTSQSAHLLNVPITEDITTAVMTPITDIES